MTVITTSLLWFLMSVWSVVGLMKISLSMAELKQRETERRDDSDSGQSN